MSHELCAAVSRVLPIGDKARPLWGDGGSGSDSSRRVCSTGEKRVGTIEIFNDSLNFINLFCAIFLVIIALHHCIRYSSWTLCSSFVYFHLNLTNFFFCTAIKNNI